MNKFIRQKAETAKHRNAKQRQTEEQVVQKKGATDFFAVTFTNIDGFS